MGHLFNKIIFIILAALIMQITTVNVSGASTDSQGIPTVTNINPSSGSANGGTQVIITGTGFAGATSVKFGGITSPSFSYSSSNPTSMTAISPMGSGSVDVTVTGPGGTSATSTTGKFTYTGTIQAPTVTNISPSSGPTSGGTQVTITGTGFLGATSVKFGGITSPSFSYSGSNLTSMTAISPMGSGSVDVTVTGPGGTSSSSSSNKFTYFGSTPTAPLLAVDSTNNTIGQSINLGFNDNPTWRTAINGITVNGTALSSSQYTVSVGNINIAANVFTTSGNYNVIVKAAGYSDATITQTMETVATSLKASPLVQVGTHPTNANAGMIVGIQNITDSFDHYPANPNVIGYTVEIDYDPQQVNILEVTNLTPLGDVTTNMDQQKGQVRIFFESSVGVTALDKLLFVSLDLIGTAKDLTDITVQFSSAIDQSLNIISVPQTTTIALQRGKVANETVNQEVNLSDTIAGLQYLAGLRNAGLEPGEVNTINMASIHPPELVSYTITPTVKDIIVLMQYLVYLRNDSFQIGSNPANSIISPTTSTFDKNTGDTSAGHYVDIPVTMTLNGNTLSSVKNGYVSLIQGTDYVITGNTLTLKKEYLATQSVSNISLIFQFNAGENQSLSITISDTTVPSGTSVKMDYIGHSGFEIISPDSYKILTDPFYAGEFDLPSYTTGNISGVDLVTVSHLHSDHNNVSIATGADILYGVNPITNSYNKVVNRQYGNDVTISTYLAPHFQLEPAWGNISAAMDINVDGIRIVHMGDSLGVAQIDQTYPMTNNDLQTLIGTGIDVLLLPVGDAGMAPFSSTELYNVLSELNPKIVIPIHRWDGNQAFLDMAAANGWMVEDKASQFTISSNDLNTLPGKVIWNVSARGNLSNLVSSMGLGNQITFNPFTTTYSVIPSSASTITLTPTTANSGAAVSVNGTSVTSGHPITVTLRAGSNDIPIIVTDGPIVKTYHVSVYK